jgi:hypothetical protein
MNAAPAVLWRYNQRVGKGGGGEADFTEAAQDGTVSSFGRK